jgi:hypothetical protein
MGINTLKTPRLNGKGLNRNSLGLLFSFATIYTIEFIRIYSTILTKSLLIGLVGKILKI